MARGLATHALTAAFTATVGYRLGHRDGRRGTGRLSSRVPTQPATGRHDVRVTEHRVRDLVARDAVDIALQPLVSLVDGTVAGVEALARFPDGRPPVEWFDDARACGLAPHLDASAFRQAVRLLPVVPPEVYLSVNASPELLVDGRFQRELSSCSLPLERLVVEITEHARVPDYDALSAAVGTLRDEGVRFAIDDTGAGYASLNHVLQLRPEIIKLDRTLVTDLAEDRARRSLVTALVLLAFEIGATVTGEGVETRAQLESLATLGVDQAQGYLLARPTLDREAWSSWWTDPMLSPLAAAN